MFKTKHANQSSQGLVGCLRSITTFGISVQPRCAMQLRLTLKVILFVFSLGARRTRVEGRGVCVCGGGGGV